MINPETRVIAVDLNNVAGDKTPAGRLKTGIMYLLAGQIAGGDFTLPQYRDEVLKQLPREYHEIALKRINQLDQEVKTKVYDELHTPGALTSSGKIWIPRSVSNASLLSARF